MVDDIQRRLTLRLIVKQQESGLSHRAFAETIGVSESYWWHIRERERASLAVLRQAARRYPDFGIELMTAMVA